ncbi:MAG: ABC transporter substrate-binding protein [Gammaproteobacteria bacterium]|nr:ABC transporter substrate-binding protein [Gammaproteobacteria bacterium]
MINAQIKYLMNSLYVVTLLISSTLTAAEVESPVDMLKRTSDEVIEVLKQRREEINENPDIVYEIVDQYIVPHLDDVTLAKLALGKNWRQASNEQKIEFVDEFRELLIRTYGKSLQEFKDQKIEFSALRDYSGEERVVVKSEVLQSGGPSIPVDYRMRLKDGEWKVYDIIIDGVSLVTNYRGTFAQEMRKGGMEQVLKMLREKKAEVSEGKAAPDSSVAESSR